jgi:hypothetical protein
MPGMDGGPVDGACAVQAARVAVRALVKDDPWRAQETLQGLSPDGRIAAAAALAYVVAAVEYQNPGVLDPVWESVETQVASLEVDRDLRDLFADDLSMEDGP